MARVSSAKILGLTNNIGIAEKTTKKVSTKMLEDSSYVELEIEYR